MCASRCMLATQSGSLALRAVTREPAGPLGVALTRELRPARSAAPERLSRVLWQIRAAVVREGEARAPGGSGRRHTAERPELDRAGDHAEAASAGRRRPGRRSCEQHSARVYRLAYRLTGNTHDAEDLTQEVFVRVFRSLSHLHAGHLRGLAAPDHHQPVPGPGPAQAAHPVRRARRRRGERLRGASRRRPRPSTTGTWTTTSRPRSRRCRRTSAPPSCCATSRACPTRRSPPRWASSSAPSAAASTAAGPSCATALAHRRPRRPAIAPKVAAPTVAVPTVVAPTAVSGAPQTAPVPLAGDL